MIKINSTAMLIASILFVPLGFAGTKTIMNQPQKTNNSDYLYVSNANGDITYCEITQNGRLGKCKVTGHKFKKPTGIAIYQQDTGINYAYIVETPKGHGFISYCKIKADGSFSNCHKIANHDFKGAWNIDIQRTLRKTFAYVIAPTNGAYVAKCLINDDGSFGSCEQKTQTTTHNKTEGIDHIDHIDYLPTSLTFNKTGTQAFVTEAHTGMVYSCMLDAAGGIVPSKCKKTVWGFDWPYDVALNKSESFAYITNYGTNIVTVCNVNNQSKTLDKCKRAGRDLLTPWGLALYDRKGDSYAYIASNQSKFIYICKINARDNTFSHCLKSKSEFNSPREVTILKNSFF